MVAVVTATAAAVVKPWLARAGAWLPPSVFYIEWREADGGLLRAKYAVLTLHTLQACSQSKIGLLGTAAMRLPGLIELMLAMRAASYM